MSIFALLLPALWGWADDAYIIEIRPTKKIIHVDRLGMSANAGVLDVLQIMPELLDRGSSSLLPNYSIQLDGKDVGQARDVVLRQTRLVEVDVIEIATSPTASEQLNGTGGVINIRLKPVEREGVSGNVMLDASTEWAVEPSVMLNYRKNKFVLRSSVMMEYYRPTSYRSSTITEPSSIISRRDTLVQSYKQETAKLYLAWKPTECDELKMHIWETFGMDRQSTGSAWNLLLDVADQYGAGGKLYQEQEYIQQTSSDGHQLMAEVNVEYKHAYRRGGSLSAEVTYNYGNTHYTSLSDQRMLNMLGSYLHRDTLLNRAPHQLLGALKTVHPLLASTSPHSLDLQLGVNATCTFGESSSSYGLVYGVPDMTDTRTNSRTIYASPFMEWNYLYHGWTVQVGARYQYYNQYAVSELNHNSVLSDDTVSDANHCVTANVSLGCQVADGHHLRLLAARNIIRSGMRIYPVHNAEFNYIFDYTSDQHKVVTNFGLQYINTQMPSQTDHVCAVNAQLFYRHSFFSMAFAGNVYWKEEKNSGNHHWNFHYDLSWTPVFSFRNQWTLSAKLLYNSKVETWAADYGDCFFAQLRLSKDIRSWNIHVEFNDVFDYQTTDTIRGASVNYSETYDLYRRSLLIGAVYRF